MIAISLVICILSLPLSLSLSLTRSPSLSRCVFSLWSFLFSSHLLTHPLFHSQVKWSEEWKRSKVSFSLSLSAPFTFDFYRLLLVTLCVSSWAFVLLCILSLLLKAFATASSKWWSSQCRRRANERAKEQSILPSFTFSLSFSHHPQGQLLLLARSDSRRLASGANVKVHLSLFLGKNHADLPIDPPQTGHIYWHTPAHKLKFTNSHIHTHTPGKQVK